MPPDADPDLVVVLELQRLEIRRMVQEIKEKEKTNTIKRLGLEYTHGKISANDTEVSSDAKAAIAHVKELKKEMIRKLRDAAMEKADKDRDRMNVPAEEEVDDSIREARELRRE